MDAIATVESTQPGVYTWQGYDPTVRCDLTSTAVEADGKLVFIDPVALTDTALATLLGDRLPGAILLTNGNHQRDSLAFRHRLNIPIIAPRNAQHELTADIWMDTPSHTGYCGLQSIFLPGAGAGETAFYRRGENPILIFGDAVVHLPPEGLRRLPEKYCEDAKLAKASLSSLAGLPVTALHFAHGRPIIENAFTELQTILRLG